MNNSIVPPVPVNLPKFYNSIIQQSNPTISDGTKNQVQSPLILHPAPPLHNPTAGPVGLPIPDITQKMPFQALVEKPQNPVVSLESNPVYQNTVKFGEYQRNLKALQNQAKLVPPSNPPLYNYNQLNKLAYENLKQEKARLEEEKVSYSETEVKFADAYQVEAMQTSNFFTELEADFGCRIEAKGSSVKLVALVTKIDLVKEKLLEKSKEFPAKNGKWQYLSDEGYKDYSPGINRAIETEYLKNFLNIKGENYQDYQLSLKFDRENIEYILYFAKIDGVHIQKRVFVGEEMLYKEIKAAISNSNTISFDFSHATIRSVRRLANGLPSQPVFKRNYVWEWLHESREFFPYEEDAIYIIENAHKYYLENNKENPLVLIQGSNAITYLIHFEECIQFNEKTRFKRPIRRRDLTS